MAAATGGPDEMRLFQRQSGSTSVAAATTGPAGETVSGSHNRMARPPETISREPSSQKRASSTGPGWGIGRGATFGPE